MIVYAPLAAPTTGPATVGSADTARLSTPGRLRLNGP